MTVVAQEKPIYTEFKIQSELMPSNRWTLKGRSLKTGHWEVITSGPLLVMVDLIKEYS